MRSRTRRLRDGGAALTIALMATAMPPGVRAQSTLPDSATPVLDGGELDVREHELDNGMRFLILPRPGAPTVTFVAHVPVGSVNESLGTTGIAHFLEHLLFKGTTTIGTTDAGAERAIFDRMDAAHDSLLAVMGRRLDPDSVALRRLETRIEVLEDSARAYVVPNQFDRILSRNGARGLNASTSYEETRYYVSLPSNRAKLWFVLEADRLRNPVFREFYTERDVIAEERRLRIETSPAGLLYEAHFGAAFRVHPYGVPPTGHMDDILTLSRPRVREHFERYYGPNNTTVAMVGDIDPDSAVIWAERYFGPIEPSAPAPPVLVREPEQRGERRVEVRFDAEPQLRIGWKIPEATHPDSPGLAMLANLLVAGRDTRLYRRLVRDERLATAVTAGTGPGSRYPGLFTIQATPRSPHSAEEVETAIYQELERLRTTPPSPDELERVRTRLVASEIRRLASKEGLAFQIVASEALWGDWRETFRAQERMQSVSADDIVDLLNRYFEPERRTVAILRRGDPAADDPGGAR